MYTPASPIRSGSFPYSGFSPKWEYKPTDPTSCSHLYGSLGPHPSHLTDIVWHELNSGVQFGICLNCQRQFWPSDPDYVEWRKKPSAQKMSSAGKEEPIEPDEVVEYTSPSRVVGDFDLILFGSNAYQILVRGKGHNESI